MSYQSRKAQADAFREKVDTYLVKHTLSKCRYCLYINPNKNTKHCEECFLLNAGIIDEIPKPNMVLYKDNPEEYKRQQADRELIIEKNMRVGELVDKCSDFLNAAHYVAGQQLTENQFIQSQNVALEDKCNRFGRPSKLSSRTFLYITHWKNADPKPSYNALSKIVKVSTTQVIRDLKELGWIAADKYIDEYVED